MRRLLTVFLFVAIIGCARTDGGVDASDAGAAQESNLAGGGLAVAPQGGGFCCPIENPTCECFKNGGWVARNDPALCLALCDLAPPLETTTEQHGCKYVGGPNSCLTAIDAGSH